MTEGSIFRTIFLYSLPLIAGNFLQQLYNAFDSVIVGNFVGETALAAVGASGQIIYFLISLIPWQDKIFLIVQDFYSFSLLDYTQISIKVYFLP